MSKEKFSNTCPVCQEELVTKEKYFVCPNEISKLGPWCPIRYHYKYVADQGYFSIRISIYMMIVGGGGMIIKRQTGGCNEFDDPPIVNIEIEDGNSLFDFSDLSSIEEQLKVWLAFS